MLEVGVAEVGVAEVGVAEVGVAGEPLVCADVRGFREALVAASDPRAPAPPRLILVAPSMPLIAWLEAWSLDDEQVRRTVAIARRFDSKEIRVVATICAHGYGVETALAVESVFLSRSGAAAEILRSGVHLKADVEAALARYDAEEACTSDDPFPATFFVD